jgi:flagellar assembly protein FliH
MAKNHSSFESQARQPAGKLSPYVYTPAPGWIGVAGAEESDTATATMTMEDCSPSDSGAGLNAGVAPQRAKEESPAAKSRARAAWEEGYREGQARTRAELEAGWAKEREPLAETIRQFSAAREEYFRRVEGEVVSLALAIVRKILHREAQIDPLLMTGLVRVALERIGASQTLHLRVHPEQVHAWQDYFAHQVDLPHAPELIGDATLEHNQCRLESEMGTTDIHLESQLKEIEQGLFDLMSQKPAP